MGLIKKQGIQNTLINYLGIVLGFVNMSLIFPHLLSQDEIGLRGLMITVAGLGANFSALGIMQLTQRFFPLFKTKDKTHQGFFNLVLLIPLLGFALLLFLSFVFQNQITDYYQEKSPLFSQYFSYVILMCLGLLYANVLNAHLAILLKTVVPLFIRSVLLRILWLIQVLLYYYGYISFEGFIFFLSLSYFFQVLGLVIYGLYLKQFKLYFKWPKVRKKLGFIMLSYALFSIAAGYLGMITATIDQLMIASLIGTAPLAVYLIGQYFSSVMMVPGRSILYIATGVISYQIKRKEWDKLSSLYKKSALTMGIPGAFVFLLIWINIDDYIKLLPPGYEALKYVFFFLGLGNLFELVAGANTQIISLSRHYRFNIYAALFLAGIAILTNYLLIPIYGIQGAAMATCISLALFNLMRMLFLSWRMQIWPYDADGFKRCLVCVVPPILLSFLFRFQFDNIYLNGLLNSSFYSTIFAILIWFVRPSEDLHKLLLQYLSKINLK